MLRRISMNHVLKIHQRVKYSTTTYRTAETAVSLAFEKFPGDARPPLIILHGLLGNRNNWKSIAKSLTKTTKRTVYTLDARNHGLSPHATAMSYPIMGADLLNFLQQHSITSAAVMGHSMGGRTAMAAALNCPERISQLLVLDISPFGTSEDLSSIPQFVAAMSAVQLPPQLSMQQARALAGDALMPVVTEVGVRQFLLTNLYKTDTGEFKWRANLEAISSSFNPHISHFPLEECGPGYNGPTTFIGGSLSNYIKRSDHTAISSLFPTATFHYLEGAGHWLHADKPTQFLDLVAPICA